MINSSFKFEVNIDIQNSTSKVLAAIAFNVDDFDLKINGIWFRTLYKDNRILGNFTFECNNNPETKIKNKNEFDSYCTFDCKQNDPSYHLNSSVLTLKINRNITEKKDNSVSKNNEILFNHNLFDPLPNSSEKSVTNKFSKILDLSESQLKINNWTNEKEKEENKCNKGRPECFIQNVEANSKFFEIENQENDFNTDTFTKCIRPRLPNLEP